MKLLVTGGCGFIGSHLADALVGLGHDVTILDNLSTGHRANAPQAATVVEGDVANEALVSTLVMQSDAVFHLAAIASVQVCEQEPELAAATNVRGTELVFAAALARREQLGKTTPIIYASSAAVYGDNPALPLGEDASPHPIGNYGKHKLANEVTATAFAQYDVPSVGLRFFNVYGPRQDARSPYSGVISKFAANLLAGQPLTFFGDGEQTRDFIYVGDIVKLLLAAWEHATDCAVYNGCTGKAVSLKQLAAALGEASGMPVITRHAEARAGDIRHSRGNPSQAKAELGFTATMPLHMGLKKLLETGDA